MEGYSLTVCASKLPKLNPATQAVRPVAVGAADPNFVLLPWESRGMKFGKRQTLLEWPLQVNI
eukprot:514260-Rhodomonas_salina.1